MAVFNQTYVNYDGFVTSRFARLLIFPRYSYRILFQSRRFTGFYVVCLFLQILAGGFIYLEYNVAALKVFQIEGLNLSKLGPSFLRHWIFTQLHLSTLVTLFVSASLVSRDLASNALPLYLSRPFSRAEYVISKMFTLIILLSPITWISGLALFAFQTSLAGAVWAADNWRIALGAFVGSWFWLILLGFLTLSCSTLFKRKFAITSTLAILLYFLHPFANQINKIFQTDWGTFFSLQAIQRIVMDHLFGISDAQSPSVWPGCTLWLFVILTCCEILRRNLRAYEEA